MSDAGDFLAAWRLPAAHVRQPRRRRCRRASCARASRTCRAAPRLALTSFDLIAEVKLRSPAVGLLKAAGRRRRGRARRDLCASRRRGRVDSHRAHALRWLARRSGDQAAVRSLALAVPAMRKDFLVDAYQVLEGRAAGAGGVLAILRMLPRAELEDLIDTALGARHVRAARGLRCSPTSNWRIALVTARRAHRDLLLVGVNSRDLATLKVVPGRLDALAASLPARSAPRGRKRRGDRRRCGARRCRRIRPGTGGQRAHVGAGSGETRGRHARGRARGGDGAYRSRGSRRVSELFIKLCGMTTPEAVTAALDLRGRRHRFRVRALGARRHHRSAPTSSRRRRGGVLACVAVTRHPSRDDGGRHPAANSSPTSCRPTSKISSSSALPKSLSVLPVMRPGTQTACAMPRRVLFEGPVSGSGQTTDWEQAAGLARRAEVILAGGLNARNVADGDPPGAALRCRRVERRRRAPGIKSTQKIEQFVAAARAAALEIA